MFNELIFIIHVIAIAVFSLTALRLGPYALVASIAIQGMLSNLFVTKQIMLFGMDVTCSDAFTVGSVLGLNLLQEYYGKEITKKAIIISFFSVLFYLFLSQIHLLYIPNQFDTTQPHFFEILHLMPRITIASVFVYLISQIFDATFFNVLKIALNNKYPIARSAVCMTCSQLLDTTLFSFLALYGIVGSVLNVIVVSFAIKMVVITLFTPFIKLAKYYHKSLI